MGVKQYLRRFVRSEMQMSDLENCGYDFEASSFWSPNKYPDGMIASIPIGDRGEAFHLSFDGKFRFCGNFLDHEEGMKACMDKLAELSKENIDE